MSGRSACPWLSEARIIHVLQRGGMLNLRHETWFLHRRRDARSRRIGRALPDLVAHLHAEPEISVRQQGRRLIWTGNRMMQGERRAVPAPSLATFKPRRKAVRTLLADALLAEADREVRLRLAAAANRYLADLERALVPRASGPQWQMTRIEGGRGPQGGAETHYAASEAAARLRVLAAYIPPETQAFLRAALLEGTGRKRLAQQFCLPLGELAVRLREALITLAKAYDTVIKAPR